MKRNVKLEIEYDGTSYNGWQRQNNTDKTIQGIIEKSLSYVLKDSIEIYGSGRTDSGVHAKGQVANFYSKSELSLHDIKTKLNQTLPEDIKVKQIEEVNKRFHARMSAIGKVYSYSIWNADSSPVFERKYVYAIESKLDLTAIKKASQLLIGEHDFRSFCSDKNFKKSTIRTIYSIDIDKTGDKISIFYKGSGFLYNMVRIMTGTLIEVGLGKRTIDSIKRALDVKDRETAGFTAPPQGLCLEHVFYSNATENITFHSAEK